MSLRIEGEIPFEQRLARRETEILQVVPSSFRGIRHPLITALGNIPEEVSGKVVADMGSGMGGLAKSAHIEGIDTTIWSINPSLRRKEFQIWQRSPLTMQIALGKDYPQATKEHIAAAQQYHDAHSSSNFAHSLTDFPDDFFDVAIDNWAVHGYMPRGDQEMYDMTIGEMLRVIKPGGKIIVGYAGRTDLWEEKGIAKVGLARRHVLWERIPLSKPAKVLLAPGVTIFKPEK